MTKTEFTWDVISKEESFQNQVFLSPIQNFRATIRFESNGYMIWQWFNKKSEAVKWCKSFECRSDSMNCKNCESTDNKN